MISNVGNGPRCIGNPLNGVSGGRKKGEWYGGVILCGGEREKRDFAVEKCALRESEWQCTLATTSTRYPPGRP